MWVTLRVRPTITSIVLSPDSPPLLRTFGDKRFARRPSACFNQTELPAMQHRRRAAAAVTLLCCFYAPLRLSVSVLAPRAHPVPAAATQPLPAAGNATGLLELILLGLASSSEAGLIGHADVHWHPAYAEEEDHERACVCGDHNYCRSAGFVSQAKAFVAALLELLQQLLASVHQQSRCNARYRTPGEICRQAEFAGELARAASAHKEPPPPPLQPQPSPSPNQPLCAHPGVRRGWQAPP